MVSIIVPIYNVELYLKRCVESIITQTEKNIEIILVDDGSNDACPQMCDSYAEADSRIKVIHKPNGGLGDARNAGLNIANGDYILFIDSDDYISKNTVEQLLKRAKKYDADMVLFDSVIVNDNDEIIQICSTEHIERDKRLNLANSKAILTSSPSACVRLYKKELFNDKCIRFIPREWYEDLRLIPTIYPLCKSIVYADCEPLYYYYKRSGSIMQNGNIEKTKTQRIEALNCVLDYYNKHGIFEEYYEELEWLWIFHGFFLPSREILHFEGDYASAIKELKSVLEDKFSSSSKNKYIKTLTKKERLILYLMYHKLYGILRLMLKLRR